MSLIRSAIVQYAYVVRDIDAAIHHWANMLGAGPFLKVKPVDINVRHLYRGAPAEEIVTHAFGQCGDVQIQLTQQHNDAPSIYRDSYPDGGEGFHHMAVFVDDLEGEVARFAAAGCAIGEEIDYRIDGGPPEWPPIGRAVYMDARDTLHGFVELLERNPAIEKRFDYVRALHTKWDGKSSPIIAR